MLFNTKHNPTSASVKTAGEAFRQPSMKLNNLGPGSVISFASSSTLPQLAGKRATITQVRTYRFDHDIQISYGLDVAGDTRFSMTVAEDAEGFYLALSRELSAAEQDQWFGRDALSFFTEASTAKTIRCKIDFSREGDWAAPRYSKTVDWIEGSVLLGRMSTASLGRQVKQFHYNLLVAESGDRALEIEHEDATGESRIMVTVYRPVEDIASLAEPLPHVPVPPAPVKPAAPVMAAPEPVAVVAPVAPAAPPGFPPMPSFVSPSPVQPSHPSPVRAVEPLVLTEEEPPLFGQTEPAQPPRPDFRRLNGAYEASAPRETIHVGREEIRPQPAMEAIMAADMPPLPSFLTARDSSYLSLDEVIPPETDRVRCDLRSAKVMIDMALTRGVRVRDILREMIGLDSMMSEEVMFDLPLSDEDFRKLGQRYRLRPDSRDEIRRRLQEELQQRLIGIAKR